MKKSCLVLSLVLWCALALGAAGCGDKAATTTVSVQTTSTSQASTLSEVSTSSPGTSDEMSPPVEPFLSGLLALKAAEDKVEDSFNPAGLIGALDGSWLTYLVEDRKKWASVSSNLELEGMLYDSGLSIDTDENGSAQETYIPAESQVETAEKAFIEIEDSLRSAESIEATASPVLVGLATDLAQLIRVEVATVRSYVTLEDQNWPRVEWLDPILLDLKGYVDSEEPFSNGRKIIVEDLLPRLDNEIALEPQIVEAARQVAAARRASMAKREEIAALLSPSSAEQFRNELSFLDFLVSQ